MEPIERPMLLEESLAFAAGRLSLDFVNTICRRHGAPLELFGDVAALDVWLRSAERIYGRRIDPDGAPWRAEDGEESLARAVELRTALWEMVDAILESRDPSVAAVTTLNAFLSSGAVFSQVIRVNGVCQATLHGSGGRDPWLLEVARDAADFLCEADLSRLGQCEADTCVRVFYDTTKNHTRRWCVEKCGSRMKAARYYRRKKLAQEAV